MLTSFLMSDFNDLFYADAQASLSLIFIWIVAKLILKLSRIHLRPTRARDQCHHFRLNRPILNIPALLFCQYI